ELTDPAFLGRLAFIGFLNLLLSGDNALVIALAVRTLPRRKRLLGQMWGAFGAVALRLLFMGVVALLLRIPFLQLVGGLLLVYIPLKLVQPDATVDEPVRHGASLWEAIWIIIVADVTMSLDNVLAIAAAAHGDMVLVVLGIVLSLPIVMWGAGLLATLMTRYVWIVWLGGGVLGYVAAEMALEDQMVVRHVHGMASWVQPAVQIAVGIAIAVQGWVFAWRRRRPQVARRA